MNLIYDRTAEDVERALALAKKAEAGTLTDAEKTEWLAGMKGCYNATDMNRVEAAVKTLAAALTSAGYPVKVTPVLKGSSRAPAGYTEVEWIQSSGTQYIDTGFKPNQETKMSLNMAFLGAAGENVAGTRNSSSDTTNRFGIVTFGSTSKIGAMFRGTATQGIPVDTATHSYTLSKSGLTVDGVSYGGADSGTFACTYPVILCGWSNGSNGIAPNKSRIVSCDIYAGGALARQFVPCKNPAGTVGLYDLVGGEFYTTPLAEEPVALPSGYTQIAYLQSTGTQYIDSGVKGDSDVRVTADFEITAFGSGTTFIFGAQGTDSVRYTLGMTSAGAFRSDFGTAMTSGSEASLNTRYSADKNGNVCTVGGQTLTSAAATFTGTTNIYLFGRSYSSVSCSQIKMYRCKMYKGGTLIRDFVPCKNPDGVAGLYDIVNGTFYTNQGSGTFTAGADIVGFTAGAEVGKAEDREWQEGDVLYRSQWTTYLDNVQRLRDAYYTLAETGQLPDAEDRLDYIGANTIEKILADIDMLIGWMKSSYRRCGTFQAGNNAAHLPLKGSA